MSITGCGSKEAVLEGVDRLVEALDREVVPVDDRVDHPVDEQADAPGWHVGAGVPAGDQGVHVEVAPAGP